MKQVLIDKINEYMQGMCEERLLNLLPYVEFLSNMKPDDNGAYWDEEDEQSIVDALNDERVPIEQVIAMMRVR